MIFIDKHTDAYTASYLTICLSFCSSIYFSISCFIFLLFSNCLHSNLRAHITFSVQPCPIESLLIFSSILYSLSFHFYKKGLSRTSPLYLLVRLSCISVSYDISYCISCSVSYIFPIHPQVAIHTQLLLAGVLCVFVSLFQVVSMVASRSLYRVMVKQEKEGDGWVGCGVGGKLTMQRLKERDAVLNGLAANNFSKKNLLGKLNFQNKRCKSEKYTIFWAVVMGLYQIYFYGTFVIFSSIQGSNKEFGKNYWMNSAWQLLGEADTRYGGRVRMG